MNENDITPQPAAVPQQHKCTKWIFALGGLLIGFGLGFATCYLIHKDRAAQEQEDNPEAVEATTVRTPSATASDTLSADESIEGAASGKPSEDYDGTFTTITPSAEEQFTWEMNAAFEELSNKVSRGEIAYREHADAYNSLTYFELRNKLNHYIGDNGHEVNPTFRKSTQSLLLKTYKAQTPKLHELPSFEELHRRGKLSNSDYQVQLNLLNQLNQQISELSK